jgi:hypothetical protein
MGLYETRLYLKQADRAHSCPCSQTWSLAWSKMQILRGFEKWVLREIFGPKRQMYACHVAYCISNWDGTNSDFVYCVHLTRVTEPQSRTGHINLCCMLRMIILSLWGRNINGCAIKRDLEALLHASTDWVPKPDSCFPVLNQLAFPNLYEVPFPDFLQPSASSTHVVGLEGKGQISRSISMSCYQIVGQDHNVEPKCAKA